MVHAVLEYALSSRNGSLLNWARNREGGHDAYAGMPFYVLSRNPLNQSVADARWSKRVFKVRKKNPMGTLSSDIGFTDGNAIYFQGRSRNLNLISVSVKQDDHVMADAEGSSSSERSVTDEAED